MRTVTIPVALTIRKDPPLRRMRIAAIVAAAIMLATPPAMASSTPDPLPTTDRQIAMSAAVAAIKAVDPGNYGSAVANPDALVLYWRGTPSPAVAKVIEEQRKTVPITVRAAAYGADELLAEAFRLSTNPAIGQAGQTNDASGINVAWAGAPDPAVREWAESTSRFPLHWQAEPVGQPDFTSRQDDGEPYSAGARTTDCTLGFTFRAGGVDKAFTAAHCGNLTTVIKDGGGGTIGTIVNRWGVRDLAALTANGKGWTWDGGVQSTYSKAVAGAAPALINNEFCTSGSRSGVRCGIKVTAVGVVVGTKGPYAQGDKIDGTSAVGDGDSGGPAYATTSNNRVIAQGIISAMSSDHYVTCVGEVGGGRLCSKRVWIIDISEALSIAGGTIKTG